MPFQPFGYPIDIQSPMPVADAKAAIRARKKRWLEKKNGPRGWIVGPVLCLWNSAFERDGPMLLATISSDGSGTRIRGVAGSDLNGVVLFVPLVALLGILLVTMIAAGTAPLRVVVVISLAICIGLPVTLWFAHKDRHKAMPLVRFLNDAVVPAARQLRKETARIGLARRVTLHIDGERIKGRITAGAVYDALHRIGTGGFVVLQASPHAFIQAAKQGNSYIIEWCEEDRDLWRASRDAPSEFSFEEVLAAFTAFGSGGTMPAGIAWIPVTAER